MALVHLIRKLEGVEPSLREVLLGLFEEIEKQNTRLEELYVSRLEFEELKKAVQELSQKVNELAEAQRRTEEVVRKLVERQDRLEEGQKRLEERQDRLEKALAELAEAQRKTEEELKKLAAEHTKTRRRLEGLSDTVGYTLENAAYRALPAILKSYGLEVEGRLIRKYVRVGRVLRQVNIYGHARRNGERVLILGEVKTRPSKKEISRFEKLVDTLARAEGLSVFRLFVAHDFPPDIEDFLRSRDILPVWSYDLEG